MNPLIITKKEAEKVLKKKGGKLKLSFDLGRSYQEAVIKDNSLFIAGQTISLSDLENLKPNFIYSLEENSVKKVAFFSEETNLYYKLEPTSSWPTFKISATPMHRHIHISPKKDTETKIKTLAPIKGKVLDTCTGLGYTAILSSRHATRVHTFEKDKNALFIASYNPYSRELFSKKNIVIHKEDVFLGIHPFHSSFFDRIIHDPPTFKRSPMLYSLDFYNELYRVLKKRGILYHYCPFPGKTKERKFYLTIVKLLKRAGFSLVSYNDESSGIRAIKK